MKAGTAGQTRGAPIPPTGYVPLKARSPARIPPPGGPNTIIVAIPVSSAAHPGTLKRGRLVVKVTGGLTVKPFNAIGKRGSAPDKSDVKKLPSGGAASVGP